MKINSMSSSETSTVPPDSAEQKVAKERSHSFFSLREPERDERKVSPEELLDKIKALTEDGLYTVRFEHNKDADALVIKLVDRESGELIRQIPPEELLGTAKSLKDFRGNVINTES